MKIGVSVIATGKYYRLFFDQLYRSLQENFVPECKKTIFLYTDAGVSVNDYNDVVSISVDHEPWPMPTLKRFDKFQQTRNIYELFDIDLMFYIDVDMRVVEKISLEEVNSELVGTVHPGFYNKPFQSYTIERNEESLACIRIQEIIDLSSFHYYAGGFFGGHIDRFNRMAEVLQQNIQSDLDNGIIAVWHDESHLNHYFNVIEQPTLKLSPSYCYPESWNLPFEKKIIALDKDHRNVRTF